MLPLVHGVCRSGARHSTLLKHYGCVHSPIINATYSDDGSVQDICRALSLRLREPNAVASVISVTEALHRF